MVTATTAQKQVQIGPTELLINNEWVKSVSGRRFETINPATDEVICEVAEADAQDKDSVSFIHSWWCAPCRVLLTPNS